MHAIKQGGTEKARCARKREEGIVPTGSFDMKNRGLIIDRGKKRNVLGNVEKSTHYNAKKGRKGALLYKKRKGKRAEPSCYRKRKKSRKVQVRQFGGDRAPWCVWGVFCFWFFFWGLWFFWGFVLGGWCVFFVGGFFFFFWVQPTQTGGKKNGGVLIFPLCEGRFFPRPGRRRAHSRIVKKGKTLLHPLKHFVNLLEGERKGSLLFWSREEKDRLYHLEGNKSAVSWRRHGRGNTHRLGGGPGGRKKVPDPISEGEKKGSVWARRERSKFTFPKIVQKGIRGGIHRLYRPQRGGGGEGRALLYTRGGKEKKLLPRKGKRERKA